MSKKWLGILVVLLVVLAAGLLFVQQNNRVDDQSAALVPADNSLITADAGAVYAEARVVPVRQTTLAFSSGGPVAGVNAAEGDVVKMGDLLAQLDITDQEIAVQQAEAAIYLAEANLAAAESMLAQAGLNLEGAHLAVRDSRADLALVAAGATEEEVALAGLNVSIAEAGITQASGNRAASLEGASQAEITAAEARLAFAQTELDNAQRIYLPILQDSSKPAGERDLAGLRLNGAQATLNAAQIALNRLLTGATSSEQVAANSGVQAAASQRDVAQAQLDLLLAGAQAEQITIAEAKVASAETGILDAESRVAGAQSAVAQAEAALLEAQAGLAIAESEREQRTLIAPFDGTLSAVEIKAGDIVQPGIPVMILADLSQWQVETTDLSELNIVDVTEGSPVEILIDAFPDRPLRGQVRRIAATAAEVRGDVTYVTTIDLMDTGELPLRWGMTAFINLSAGEGAGPLDGEIGQPSPSNVEAEGQLVPFSYVNMAFSAAGRVAAAPAAQGEWVQAGAPLIQLDTAALRLALDQADARAAAAAAGVAAAENQQALAITAVAKAEDAVIIAQANMALLKAGPRPAEIAAAEAALAAAESTVTQAQAGREVALNTISAADIASAEANLALATAELLALEEAYQQILDSCFEGPDGNTVCPLYGTLEEQTRGQLEAARANQVAARSMLDVLNAGPTFGQRSAAAGSVALSIANRDLARAQLDLLLAGPSAERIEKAEVTTAQAELGVTLAQAQMDQAETAVDQAEAGLAAVEAARSAIQAALDRMTLVAAMDGTLTSLDANPGEMIAPGHPVATVADTSGWLVETTNVSELDIPYIAIGNTAEVRFDALPDGVLTGVVTKISVMPGLTLGDVVYQVTVLLEDASDLPLRWGMTALVDVSVD